MRLTLIIQLMNKLSLVQPLMTVTTNDLNMNNGLGVNTHQE